MSSLMLRDVFSEVRSVDWYMLGLHLGISKHELDVIKRDYSSFGPDRCLVGTLGIWLKNAPSVSWENIADAIEKLPNTKLASKIRRKYSSLYRIQQIIRQQINEQGSLRLTSVRTLFIGPPRVGKTSTKNNLIGQKSPSVVTPSTVIDKPVTVPVYTAAQSDTVLGWKPQLLQEQVEIIFSHMLSTQGSSSSSSTASGEYATQAFQPQSGNPSTPEYGSSNNATPSLHLQAETTPQQISVADYVMDQLTPGMRQTDWVVVRDKLKMVEDVTFLQLIDVGGQPEIQEVLPLLLHGQALNLLFFRLDKELDEKYQVTFSCEGIGKCLVEYESESTIRNTLQVILSSIASLKSEKNRSPVLLVGTHFDQVSEDTLRIREESIQEAFKDANFLNNIIQPVRFDRRNKKVGYITPIDNATGSTNNIKKLRDTIENVVENDLHPMPIPTATLLFHLILAKKFEASPGWCTVEEATEIAVKCGIAADKVEGILEYLHNNIGTILHYRDVDGLRNRIICDVNKVLKPFNNIFAFVYGSDLHQLQKVEHIRSTAEIKPDWMDKICDASSSDIPTSEIVALLEKRLILHKKSDGSAYVMPCLLFPDLGVDKEANDLAALKALFPAPLLLVPDTGYVPLGIFLVLVVKLNASWELCDKERFRNRVLFRVGDEGLLFELRMLPSYIELRHIQNPDIPDQNHSILAGLLSECRQLVFDNLRVVSKKYDHSLLVNWQYGYYCPHGLKRSGITGHPATFYHEPGTQPGLHVANPQTLKMLCYRVKERKCSEHTCPLEEKHEIWFKSIHGIKTARETSRPHDVQPSDHTPSIRDLVNAVDTVTKWKPLGLQLGVKPHVLDEIEKDEHGVQDKKIKMFKVWVNSDTEASWSSLVRALERMGEKRVAREVSRAHNIQPSGGESTIAKHHVVCPLVHKDECSEEDLENKFMEFDDVISSKTVSPTFTNVLQPQCDWFSSSQSVSRTEKSTSNVNALKHPIQSSTSEAKRRKLNTESDALQEPFLIAPPQDVFLEWVVSEIPDQWRLFGSLLNIPLNQLNALAEKHIGDPVTCFLGIYNSWQCNPLRPFTWDTVVQVLETKVMGQKSLAKNIEFKLTSRKSALMK